MWRAFAEMRELGWLDGPSPRLVSVQSEGCAPVVRAFDSGEKRITPWSGARTVASGLQVPSPFADELILRSIQDSGGVATAVSEEDILSAMRELAETEGCFACPEGAASLAGLKRLCASGVVSHEDRVVIFNTGSGLKYPEAWRLALERPRSADQLNA
jgi:threonine synthase